MRACQSEAILLDTPGARSTLAESLLSAGYRVVSNADDLSRSRPSVAIVDCHSTIARDRQFAKTMEDGAMSVIVLGAPPVWMSAPRTEIALPSDVGIDELQRSLELATKVAELCRSLRHEQLECQRWVRLAMHDPLTNLPNRRKWDRELARQLASRDPISVGVIDVDHFKQINEQDGYLVGDDVLRRVAETLRRQLRRDDLVVRLGGDEFGVILLHVNAPIAEQVMDRLRNAVCRKLTASGLPAPTLSAGFVAVGPNDLRESKMILQAATQALQAAKRLNRNRTVGGVVGLRSAFRGKLRK